MGMVGHVQPAQRMEVTFGRQWVAWRSGGSWATTPYGMVSERGLKVAQQQPSVDALFPRCGGLNRVELQISKYRKWTNTGCQPNHGG